MEHSIDTATASTPHAEPVVRKVNALRPLLWLHLGARDVLRSLRGSATAGLVIALLGLILMLVTWKVSYLGPATLGGFLIVAPFIAMPVYVLSRQLEQGQALDMSEAWHLCKANASSIAQFGLMLALGYLVWERLAAIVFALFYEGQALHLSKLPSELLSGEYSGLILTFIIVGGVLASAIFASSVVSAPLLLDRPVDVITAVLTSLRCCARNTAAMVLWAALIAFLTALGFATMMIGLVLIFPWLAHATWHAYRDMVES